MKFSTAAFLLLAILSISSTCSFSLAPLRAARHRNLNMAWGLQKLGQPVINTQTVAPPVPETGTLFGRRQQTNGNDERSFFGRDIFASDDRREQHYDELATLDLNFKKQSLLVGLSSQRSEAEKIERIQQAASVEGLLPQALLFSSVSTVSMKAGGLTSEWDFDF